MERSDPSILQLKQYCSNPECLGIKSNGEPHVVERECPLRDQYVTYLTSNYLTEERKAPTNAFLVFSQLLTEQSGESFSGNQPIYLCRHCNDILLELYSESGSSSNGRNDNHLHTTGNLTIIRDGGHVSSSDEDGHNRSFANRAENGYGHPDSSFHSVEELIPEECDLNLHPVTRSATVQLMHPSSVPHLFDNVDRTTIANLMELYDQDQSPIWDYYTLLAAAQSLAGNGIENRPSTVYQPTYHSDDELDAGDDDDENMLPPVALQLVRQDAIQPIRRSYPRYYVSEPLTEWDIVSQEIVDNLSNLY